MVSENDKARAAERRWLRLCKKYLPITCPNSIWKLSRRLSHQDPAQGWKLHISATSLCACDVIDTVGPYLQRQGLCFKGPRALNELVKLNAGLNGEFSQVGKFITVYPPSVEAAVEIARGLHVLTSRFRAPVVPYDERFRKGSSVYYRYGAFSARRVKFHGKLYPAIGSPNGRLIVDRREPKAAVPHWLTDPFRNGKFTRSDKSLTPLETDYDSYQAIVQRGRGGTYRAVDISSGGPQPCIIKEGRRYGETNSDGRDGYDRVKREAAFLRSVSARIAAVPRVRRTFRANGDYYLVQEAITGRSLESVIACRQHIARTRLLRYCTNMAQIVFDVHRAGWAWRDCKPANLLCQNGGTLRAVDFEWACRLSAPDAVTFHTRGYVPRQRGRTPQQIDFYALGTSLMQLIARRQSPLNCTKAFKRAARRLQLPRWLVARIRSLRNSSSTPELLQLVLAELKTLACPKSRGTPPHR